jgi:hypothetical protein
MRLHALPASDFVAARNTLTQILIGRASQTTTRLEIAGMSDGQRVGLGVLQVTPNWLGVVQADGIRRLTFSAAGAQSAGPVLSGDAIQVRLDIADEMAWYSYSLDEGKTFVPFGERSKLRFSWWKGARPALFSFTLRDTEAQAGHVDVDWVRVTHDSAQP